MLLMTAMLYCTALPYLLINYSLVVAVCCNYMVLNGKPSTIMPSMERLSVTLTFKCKTCKIPKVLL